MNRITPATLADAEEILELQKLAYQSEAVMYNDWSLPPLIQTLDEIRKKFADTTFLKACDSGGIIGSVRASAHDETCEIGQLIVHPDFWGQGIGTQLLMAVEARFPGVKRFELFTGSKSVRNIRLYERLGYVIFETKPLSGNVDLVFMEKRRL